MKVFASFILVLAIVAPALGKVFTRCSLAAELYRLGVPKKELARWTCIAQRESAYNTTAVGKRNKNGSNDYGIFQINSRYWCQPPDQRVSENDCQINCNDLLKDDITPSLTCARQIQKQQGWTAWAVWKYCNGTLPCINECLPHY